MKRAAEGDETEENMSHKEIALQFFTKKVGSDNIWVCLCKTERKSARGYENLFNHIVAKHPQYKDLLDKKKKGLPIESFLYPVERNLFGWLGTNFLIPCDWLPEWVIEDSLPLVHVEKKNTRKYTSLKPLSIRLWSTWQSPRRRKGTSCYFTGSSVS